MNPVTKLEQRLVLLQAGQPIEQVYFVDSGLVSLLAIANDGRAIETGVVGSGGVVGADVILGMERAAIQAIVALAGGARPMPISQFLALVESSPPFRDDVLRSLDFQLFQAQRNALCHALHSIQARFCRWLLQASELQGTDLLDVTQEFCRQILGVQRTSVSMIANALQREGALSTRRGKIYLKDKAQLEDRACDCYARLKPYLDSVGRKGLQQRSQTVPADVGQNLPV